MPLKKYTYYGIFGLLGILALEVPLAIILGANTRFTLFDIISPTALSMLGTWPGVLALSLVQIVNKIIHQNATLDIANVVRFVTPFAAALFFYKRSRVNYFIPLVAIVVFLSHPTGQQVWYFSLFWIIPILCNYFAKTSVFARSLGATFTAHAVGGAVWIYAFSLPAAVWQGLIPVVIFERLVMTGGIILTYYALKNIRQALTQTNAATTTTNKDQEVFTSQR